MVGDYVFQSLSWSLTSEMEVKYQYVVHDILQTS